MADASVPLCSSAPASVQTPALLKQARLSLRNIADLTREVCDDLATLAGAATDTLGSEDAALQRSRALLRMIWLRSGELASMVSAEAEATPEMGMPVGRPADDDGAVNAPAIAGEESPSSAARPLFELHARYLIDPGAPPQDLSADAGLLLASGLAILEAEVESIDKERVWAALYLLRQAAAVLNAFEQHADIAAMQAPASEGAASASAKGAVHERCPRPSEPESGRGAAVSGPVPGAGDGSVVRSKSVDRNEVAGRLFVDLANQASVLDALLQVVLRGGSLELVEVALAMTQRLGATADLGAGECGAFPLRGGYEEWLMPRHLVLSRAEAKYGATS